MPNIGPMELIVVLAIALIFFGPKRLPELGNSLGKGIREFKGSISGDKDDDEDVALPEPTAVVVTKEEVTSEPPKVPVA